MSDETISTPPGWYPDPDGGGHRRWWDGSQWTAHTSAPAAQPYTGARPQIKAPEGTDWNTPWIWLVLIVPVLPLLPLFFVDWTAAVAVDPYTYEPDLQRQLEFYTSPAYLASTLGGFVTYGLTVLFAYFDRKALQERQVPAPFHWACSFLSSIVYAIGRSVVVKRRTGRGSAVMWLAIAEIVLSFVVAFVITGMVIAAVFEQIAFV